MVSCGRRGRSGCWSYIMQAQRRTALPCFLSGRLTRLYLWCVTRTFRVTISGCYIGVAQLHSASCPFREDQQAWRLCACAAPSSQCRQAARAGRPACLGSSQHQGMRARCGHAGCLRAMRALRPGCEARAPLLCWRRISLSPHVSQDAEYSPASGCHLLSRPRTCSAIRAPQ